MPRSAANLIGTEQTEQRVIPVIAAQPPTLQIIVAVLAIDSRPAAGDDRVVPAARANDALNDAPGVVPFAEDDRVDAEECLEVIRAATGVDVVAALAAVDHIRAVAAVNDVDPRQSADGVVARAG